MTISGSTNLSDVMGFSRDVVTEANYPDATILSLPFPSESFDYVITNQVMEHVEGDPFLAFQECARVLKPGGVMVHATVFNYNIHKNPGDFWRFTPDALELMARDVGCTRIIDCGGWGNQLVWIAVWSGLLHEPVPLWKWHPYHWLATMNNRLWPIAVWVIAEKPVTSDTPGLHD